MAGLAAEAFLDAARELGFGLFTGVPCSYLQPFINYVIGTEGLRYIGAANEGDAVAIAAGSELGGVPAVAMFQNSGLGNAVNPLTSLTHTFRIPVLLIPTLRGDPQGPADEPQHELMGAITTRLLELMEIPWEPFPTSAPEIGPALERARAHMTRHGRPYALVMRRGTVAPWPAPAPPAPRRPAPYDLPESPADPTTTRAVLLAAVRDAAAPDDLLIASTGYTGRELFALGDSDHQLYMVGSMGCAAALGLGLAAARPERRVLVLDGDGAALMRLGLFATVGHEQPHNLVHVLLDNGLHESTGGQATVSRSIDFARVAAACGYPVARRATGPGELAAAIAAHARAPRLTFVHAPMRPGVLADIPRPSVTPEAKAERFRAASKDPAR